MEKIFREHRKYESTVHCVFFNLVNEENFSNSFLSD